MESMFVWIVVFAGVAIALLGAVLVASERELKTKRREVEVLFGKLESVAAGNTPAQSGPAQADRSAELTELRATNQDLQNQIAALCGKLELSRRSIEELEATQHSDAGAQRELDGLQAANDQLKVELNDLRSRLRVAEGRLQGSSEPGQDRGQSQAQIANLQLSLDESHVKIRELEGALQKAPNLAEIEAKHREEQKSLQVRITELESEIGAGREKLQEFEAVRARAAAAERAQQALREEIRRHEEEIPRWQARISEAEEHRQRLAALQTPYNELLAKHASLADKQRELEADLAAFTQLITVPTRATLASSSSTAGSAASALGNGVNNHSTDERQAAEVTASEPVEAAAQPKRAHRFGIFSVAIMLAAGTGAGGWYFSSDLAESTVPAVSASARQTGVPMPAPRQTSNTGGAQLTVIKPQAISAEPAVKESSAPIVKEPSAPAQPAHRVAGTYEVTRISRVYAAPSELSQSLGDIEAGTKVSVVDSHDGWLEVHSKHGRPPGYIRKEAAARIAGQN